MNGHFGFTVYLGFYVAGRHVLFSPDAEVARNRGPTHWTAVKFVCKEEQYISAYYDVGFS